jgi:hypothetical protein
MVCEHGQERDGPEVIESHDTPRERGLLMVGVNTAGNPGRERARTLMPYHLGVMLGLDDSRSKRG